MGAIDKFLNVMKFNEDDQDFVDDDFEEEEVAPAPKRAKNTNNDVQEEKPAKKMPKLSGMRSNNKRSGGQEGMELCVIRPTTIDDGREITETLLSNRAVVLNLEGLDFEISQRIIDFTSGSCFAIRGNMQKISNYIFVITPSTVDISGDFQDALSAGSDNNSEFSIPSIQNNI